MQCMLKPVAKMLRHSNEKPAFNFLFRIAANHTNDLDLLLLAILIRGEGGYDKHKIIDRPLSQNKVHCLKYFCNWL